MNKSLYVSILFLMITSYIFSSKQNLIQQLHKKVSTDLLSIRKEFPKSQPTVYSLLDQVCKIYQVAKINIEKKDKLKNIIKTKDEQYKTIISQNNTLQGQFENLTKELKISKQNMNNINEQLEKREVAMNMLSQEKTKLAQERNQLTEEKNKLLLKSRKTEEENKLIEQSKLIEENKQVENTIENQSLNLTSTCEPSSPL